MDILSVFCDIDDFCSRFEPAWRQQLVASGAKRHRASSLALSEVMTILVLFHGLHYRPFKPSISTMSAFICTLIFPACPATRALSN
jgi:hypothetical protein